jgi:hypothetical protein
MKKHFIILSLVLLSTIAGVAQQSTLTRKLVNGKYGFGYPSLTKKDGLGYPLVETLTIPAIYDETTNVTFADEYENLIGVEQNGKWGFIDATGTTRIPFKYNGAGYFNSGLAPVQLNGKWGFIDKTGKTVIQFKYSDVRTFYNGFAYVELAGKAGFINPSGVEIIPAKYDIQTDATYKKCIHCGALYAFQDGKSTVILNGKCGVIDTKGNFTACTDEAFDSTTFTGVVNANKDRWGTNPGAAIKGTCDKSTDIKQLMLNGKDITGITYENKMMYIGFGKLKAGDKVIIKIVHLKGCSFRLNNQLQGFDLGEGQANLAAAETKPLLQGLDSTTFFGTIIGAMAIIQSDQGTYDIKKVVLNDVDITAKLPVGQRKIINFAVFKLKKGQLATIKVVHTKASTVKMLDPPGLDIN